jgi:hypothetical protein
MKYKSTAVTVCLSDDYYQSPSGPSCKYESTYVSTCHSEDYRLSSSGFNWNIRVPTLLRLFEDYHQSSSGSYCKYESTYLRMADPSGHAV